MRYDVSVVMGSRSDWQVMSEACLMLEQFPIAFESRVVSAHRTPERLYNYAKGLEHSGTKVVIAGAGGAAHLPGMIASLTSVPVLGVPVLSNALQGVDSLLSIVQMPAGVPVATFAIGKAGAKNAALFAASILASYDSNVQKSLQNFRSEQTNAVPEFPS